MDLGESIPYGFYLAGFPDPTDASCQTSISIICCIGWHESLLSGRSILPLAREPTFRQIHFLVGMRAVFPAAFLAQGDRNEQIQPQICSFSAFCDRISAR